MKKGFLLIAAFMLFNSVTYAQISYGIKGGLNICTYSKFPENISEYYSDPLVSFHIVGFADIPINSKFSIQSGLSFQKKDLLMMVVMEYIIIKQCKK